MDVMLMRLVWDGERCGGGVRDPLPESSSAQGTISSPIRTLSRLPSSTPFPSHRPHGNLEGTGELYSYNIKSRQQHKLTLEPQVMQKNHSDWDRIVCEGKRVGRGVNTL